MNRQLFGALALAATAVSTPMAQDPGQEPPAPPPPMNIPKDDARIQKLKAEAVADVEAMKDHTQQMVDSIFSFGELGFQEVETHRYVVDILTKNGFTVEEGIAGVPTAFMASWGSGKPVIALGSDIDGIPQASQKPGVAYHDPLVEGAPGHGEGHNSGVPLNITAAKSWSARRRISFARGCSRTSTSRSLHTSAMTSTSPGVMPAGPGSCRSSIHSAERRRIQRALRGAAAVRSMPWS
jgi:hypothetical protein